MTYTIGVLVSSHTPRWTNGMMHHCMSAIADQLRIPDQVAIAVDKHGKGSAWSKNQALGMLSTDIVAVCDSDDMWYNNHLLELEEAFALTDCDISYSNWDGNNPFPEEWKTLPWDPDNPRHTSTTIGVKRDLLVSVGGYRSGDSPGTADDDWLTLCAMLAQGAKVHHIQKTTWNYQCHDGNTSGLASRWI